MIQSKRNYPSEQAALEDLHLDPYAPSTASVVKDSEIPGMFRLATDDVDGAERQNQGRREDELAELWAI